MIEYHNVQLMKEASEFNCINMILSAAVHEQIKAAMVQSLEFPMRLGYWH